MATTRLTRRAGLAATSTATVSGRVTYRDRLDVVHPAREVSVYVMVVVAGGGDDRVVPATTDADGRFTLTFVPSDGDEYYAEADTQNQTAVVRNPDDRPYTVTSGHRTLQPGDSWSNVALNLPQASEAGRAFALFDALKTVSDYYDRIKRPGWDSRLTVTYPSGTNKTYANADGVFIAGGDVRCDRDWCKEDAFDWDVLAHEVGHVVADQADIDDSAGGDHIWCNDAWSGDKSERMADRIAEQRRR
jgi:hypothetical protein